MNIPRNENLVFCDGWAFKNKSMLQEDNSSPPQALIFLVVTVSGGIDLTIHFCFKVVGEVHL